MIRSENLPDPTKDDSLLKLKDDKAFWSFVEDLKKSRWVVLFRRNDR